MPRRKQARPNYRIEPRGKRGTWQIVWTEHGRTQRLSTGTTVEDEAKRALAAFIAGREGPPVKEQRTIGAMLDAYYEDRAEKVIDRVKLRGICVRLKEHFGSTLVDNFNRVLNRGFIEKRRKEGVQDTTIRNDLLILRAAYNWGRQEWTQIVPQIDALSPGPRRERWLSHAEGKALLDACRAHHVHLAVALALYTGARRGAIMGLRWADVDLDMGVINYQAGAHRQTKKRRAVVRISDQLRPVLEEARLLARSAYVVEYGARPVRAVEWGFRQACQRAGLGRDVVFHTLRHTAATWMAMAGQPLGKIAEVLGQSPFTTQRVYAKYSPDYQQSAIDALPRILEPFGSKSMGRIRNRRTGLAQSEG